MIATAVESLSSVAETRPLSPSRRRSESESLLAAAAAPRGAASGRARVSGPEDGSLKGLRGAEAMPPSRIMMARECRSGMKTKGSGKGGEGGGGGQGCWAERNHDDRLGPGPARASAGEEHWQLGCARAEGRRAQPALKCVEQRSQLRPPHHSLGLPPTLAQLHSRQSTSSATAQGLGVAESGGEEEVHPVCSETTVLPESRSSLEASARKPGCEQRLCVMEQNAAQTGLALAQCPSVSVELQMSKSVIWRIEGDHLTFHKVVEHG
eukprot:2827635-Rhodomonas_salina.3